MADIGETQQSEVVRIANPDESNLVEVSANKDLFSEDVTRTDGVQGAITLGTTAIEVKVGASKLVNRKSVTVYNNSNKTIYWGYTSGVTTATGTPITKDGFAAWSRQADKSIYIISADTGLDIRVTEA